MAISSILQDGTSPLYIACMNGHSDIVNILISQGTDVNVCREVCVITSVAL